MRLALRHRSLLFPRRPLVMGIVNINDDSFCRDGSLEVSTALAQAERMLREGADIIDIGAESARTNRGPISIDEEVARLIPFIRAWPALLDSMPTPPWDAEQCWPPILSINTWRSEVVAQVLPEGGDLLNDISALPTARNAELCAKHDTALLIMHSIGEPKVPHTHVVYPEVMTTLDTFFAEKIQLALGAGLSQDHLLLDPGIDFAKQRDDNLRIYRELPALHHFERPILLPVSRKTVIGDVLALPDPLDRDAGTVACVAAGIRRGAHVFRVHHVLAAAQAVKTLWNATVTG
ncbi:dihydropteroate synthase [Roseimicrobium gellanilyticum]|uniref:dihydropteroate synthase n=1 Tax=Roseimicrobium gellanilyticum TaxID=748857 RepID=A0A366HMF4_9BACT|nr:dihydropteroate synthase [Roseimicrobium gellanilyticum]RBP43757.1 dihydropteroate synthase [Roseimicrobium gellanilyticum]